MSRDEQRAIVERSTILLGTLDSTLHGLREEPGYEAVDAFLVESSRAAWGW